MLRVCEPWGTHPFPRCRSAIARPPSYLGLLPDLCSTSDSAPKHPRRPHGAQGVAASDAEEAQPRRREFGGAGRSRSLKQRTGAAVTGVPTGPGASSVWGSLPSPSAAPPSPPRLLFPLHCPLLLHTTHRLFFALCLSFSL